MLYRIDFGQQIAVIFSSRRSLIFELQHFLRLRAALPFRLNVDLDVRCVVLARAWAALSSKRRQCLHSIFFFLAIVVGL